MDIGKIFGLHHSDVAMLLDCARRSTEALEMIADDLRKIREDQEMP